MLPYNVLQQGLPMTVVPQGIETKGQMSIVSLRPRYPALHMSAFMISKSEQVLIVKDQSKIVKDHSREVLGGSNEKRNPRLGDRFIGMLQFDESGELYMFYAILSEREQLVGVIQLVHATLSTCPFMSVFFVLNLLSDLLLWCYI